jgi:hypothetical protein
MIDQTADPGPFEEPISMERRCQIPGCRTLFTAPSLDELRCPDCRRRGRKPPSIGQSLYGCAAALCAGV